MCEADVVMVEDLCPAALASLFTPRLRESKEVSMVFSSSPERGADEYGKALKKAFPLLPDDPQSCIRVLNSARDSGVVHVSVTGMSDRRDYGSSFLEATICLAS